ncbi:MAG: LON peptidase substrate-binding domain-containing protein, partial [Dehalococcoidia bacterium]
MELSLFPLNTVLFPGAPLPLHIFEPRYRLMIDECIEQERPFGVVLIERGPEVGEGAVPHTVGATARITAVERMPDGRMNIGCEGQDRFRILDTSSARPYLLGEVELLADLDANSGEAHAAAERVRERYLRFAQLTLALRGEWARRPQTPADPARLADALAARLPAPNATKQRLLEEITVPRRLAGVAAILDAAIEALTPRVAALQTQR